MSAKKKPAASDCRQASHDRLEHARANPENSFHKGLLHEASGAVNPASFAAFIDGLELVNDSGDTTGLDAVELGAGIGSRKLVNPLSGWAVDREVSDPCCGKIPAPPSVTSAEAAAELIELYWMALLRDVPFTAWKNNADVAAACRELSMVPLFADPAEPNKDPVNIPYSKEPITPATIFRGGDLNRKKGTGLTHRYGPYVSQFLLQDISYGTLKIEQKNTYAKSGVDYMTTFDEWLAVQNGAPRDARMNLSGENRRYLSTMRDMATYVHFDQLYEAYLNAALILLDGRYPMATGNPYGTGCSVHGAGMAPACHTSKHKNQDAFGTFGGPHILSLVTEVATRALKTVWRQKWTHLRIRPEAYAGYVHRSQRMGVQLPLGAGEKWICQSEAAARIATAHGGLLLPMAFPEGSPTHPSYGAGHATVAGACVTILKAFFDETVVMRKPVEANAMGTALVPYEGADAGELTVGYELDKVAVNIANARNMAGVHWRSDSSQSMLMGQRVAIDMLYRQSADYVEDYTLHFTTFGGNKVAISQTGLTFTHSTDPKDSKDSKASKNDFVLGPIGDGRCVEDKECALAKKLLAIW